MTSFKSILMLFVTCCDALFSHETKSNQLRGQLFLEYLLPTTVEGMVLMNRTSLTHLYFARFSRHRETISCPTTFMSGLCFDEGHFFVPPFSIRLAGRTATSATPGWVRITCSKFRRINILAAANDHILEPRSTT